MAAAFSRNVAAEGIKNEEQLALILNWPISSFNQTTNLLERI